MMNSQAFSRYFTPINVFVAGVLGGVIHYILFLWNYPNIGSFAEAKSFPILIFGFLILSCLTTIFFVPAWATFLSLYRSRIVGQTYATRKKEFLKLIFIIVLSLGVFLSLFLWARTFREELQINIPEEHSRRTQILILYAFFAVLPAGLSMILIHDEIQEVLVRIDNAKQNQSQLFPFIEELQKYRSMLQSLLTLSGILLSMTPINVAATRAVLIEVDPSLEKTYPTSYVVVFGLLFTIMLLLVYVPTHLTLSEAGRELRDRICPLNSLETLKDTVERRKSLDELLQTNVSVMQTLKSGVFTLAPLASSLLASVLGINIS